MLPPSPRPPLAKPAGAKCRHQKFGTGCTIYADRPTACRVWSCRWVADRRTAALPRPDRSHYVIDLQYDTVTVSDDATGARRELQVLQVWVDPLHPLAHRAPSLRAYLAQLGADHRIASIIRYDSLKAFVLIPPAMASDGRWHECGTTVAPSRTAGEGLHRMRAHG